jgi:transposase
MPIPPNATEMGDRADFRKQHRGHPLGGLVLVSTTGPISASASGLEGKKRTFIKGQKYTLLAHPQNLTGDARKNLKLLLSANKRLNTAYLLKESFAQLWDYNSEVWARKFFENWRAQLKWQRLKPYEDFAALIERHWDGLAAYCKPENKVSLGFVEGLNNKIRVLQRRAYGLRDEEYLRLTILTCMLPKL